MVRSTVDPISQDRAGTPSGGPATSSAEPGSPPKTKPRAAAGGVRTAPGKRAVKAAPRSRKPTAAEAERLAAYYREMLLIRRFEERAGRSYTQALVGGYLHLNLGEEAFIVGTVSAMRPTDYLFTNYREHGFAIARGADPGRVMAELYGRTDGVSKGWGGSMHMFDLPHRLMGGYGIVGGQLPLAVGAALAIDYRGGDEVVVVTMGDGTTNIGAFHESLNLAALWDLPVVFLVDNNFLGMGTAVERSSAEPDLHKRAAAYRMENAKVDGLDPVMVHQAAARAIERARAGHPFLLEVTTVRLKGHSVVDPATYRSKEDAAEALAADPLKALADRLLKAKIATPEDLEAWNAQATGRVEEAVRFAKSSPLPDPDTLFDYTYATPVPGESRRLPADPVFPIAPLVACLLPGDYYALPRPLPPEFAPGAPELATAGAAS